MFEEGRRYFVDTNVLLYAAGEPSHLKNKSVRVLELLYTSGAIAVCNTAVLEEAHFIFYRQTRDRRLTLQFLKEVQSSLGSVIAITEDIVSLAWRLFAENKRSIKSIKDYYHAASMLVSGLDVIISFDKDFDQIPGIGRIDPFCI